MLRKSLSPAEAREKAAARRKLAKAGNDPKVQRDRQRVKVPSRQVRFNGEAAIFGIGQICWPCACDLSRGVWGEKCGQIEGLSVNAFLKATFAAESGCPAIIHLWGAKWRNFLRFAT